MQSRLTWRVLMWAVLGAAAVPGCVRDSGVPPGPTVRRDRNVVVVYAACALRPTVEAAAERFEVARSGKSVEIKLGAPGELVELIEGGHVPDLLICIGDAEIGMLEREGLIARAPVEAPMDFRLAIAVPAEAETLRIRSHRDLVSSEVETVAMPSPGITSLGSDAADTLKRLEIWDELQDRLKITGTPLEALELAAAGEVDAVIIYQPCPALGLPSRLSPDSIVVVAPLDPDSERRTSIHAGVHKSSPNAPLAKLFLRYLKLASGTAEEAETAGNAGEAGEPEEAEEPGGAGAEADLDE